MIQIIKGPEVRRRMAAGACARAISRDATARHRACVHRPALLHERVTLKLDKDVE